MEGGGGGGGGGDPMGSGHALATPPPAAAQIEGVSPAGDKSLPDTSGDRKRRNPEDGGDGDGNKNCSCKKSQCMKLYCTCFASGGYCSKSCLCRDCLNRPTIHNLVNQSSNVTHDSKIMQEVIGSSPGSALDRRKGCRCKKSGCGKKYCDCFQSGVGCIRNCKCDDCRNPYGQKVAEDVLNYVLQRNININMHNGEEQSEETDEESEDEDERLGTNPRIPAPVRFPTSRESSFQQESSDEQGPPLKDHIFAKPITQFHPSMPHHTLHLNQNNGNLGSSATNGNNNGYTDHGHNLSHGNQFTIAKCVEVMNGMSDLSVVEKSIAPDVFLDLHNREVFLSLTAEVRPVWLRRKMRLLPA